MTLRSVFKSKSGRQVTAITPIHPRDAGLYLEQLLADYDRLGFDCAWHVNGMTEADPLFQLIRDWSGTVGWTWQDDLEQSFTDQDRNGAINLAMRAGSPWISPHDADETLEPRSPELLDEMLRQPRHWVVQWYNVWAVRNDTPIIRVDPPYIGYKARFYPTAGHRYEYRAGTASLYEADGRWPPRGDSGLRILHWGFCTEESRRWHYGRWDGTNGSHYWTGLVSELDKVQLKPFDPDVPHVEFIST